MKQLVSIFFNLENYYYYIILITNQTNKKILWTQTSYQSDSVKNQSAGKTWWKKLSSIYPNIERKNFKRRLKVWLLLLRKVKSEDKQCHLQSKRPKRLEIKMRKPNHHHHLRKKLMTKLTLLSFVNKYQTATTTALSSLEMRRSSSPVLSSLDLMKLEKLSKMLIFYWTKVSLNQRKTLFSFIEVDCWLI